MNEEITIGEIFRKSRADLSGKWGVAIGAVVIYIVLMIVIGTVFNMTIYNIGSIKINTMEYQVSIYVSTLINLVLDGPFALGFAFFTLNIVDNKEASVNQIFDGFRTSFATAFFIYFIKTILVMLGTIFFIIPGIIIAICFSQVFYILAENKTIGVLEAFKRSNELMKGHKWEYFLLMLTYMLLFILSVFTLLIGLFWLIPFMFTGLANFYRKLVPAPDLFQDYEQGKDHLLPQY